VTIVRAIRSAVHYFIRSLERQRWFAASRSHGADHGFPRPSYAPRNNRTFSAKSACLRFLRVTGPILDGSKGSIHAVRPAVRNV
jgi:hypothetical protein